MAAMLAKTAPARPWQVGRPDPAPGPGDAAHRRSDRLTNVRDHHRDIDQDTTPVMKGHERASHQGLGELVGQTGPVTHHPEYDTPSVGHPAGPANGY